MENILPFVDAVRNVHKRVKDGKRKQNETARTALKNISNKSGLHSNSEALPPSKRARLHCSENKENVSHNKSKEYTSKSSRFPSKSKTRRGVSTVTEDQNLDGSNSVLIPSLPSSQSSLPSSQTSLPSSQDSQKNIFTDTLRTENFYIFYETDFALNLLQRNPSETIFEVPQYIIDIYHLEQDRELEDKNILYNFFTPPLPPGVAGPQLIRQTQISKEILNIVVDWMVEVQENMEMNHETFYLAVIMMYRYMSMVPNVSKKSIQLLACTAMWLASKYEERVSPLIREFIYICDDAFTSRDFISMEQKLFFALDETCHRPISYVFLRRYSRVSDGDNMKMQFLSRYYLELTLQKQSLMLNRESLKAAGALWLARATLKFSDDARWNTALRFFTRYEEIDLIDFVQKLHSFAKDVPRSNLQTTFIKYSNKVFLEVATFPQIPDHDFQDIINRVRVIHS